jgi:hypothetical protein
VILINILILIQFRVLNLINTLHLIYLMILLWFQYLHLNVYYVFAPVLNSISAIPKKSVSEYGKKCSVIHLYISIDRLKDSQLFTPCPIFTPMLQISHVDGTKWHIVKSLPFYAIPNLVFGISTNKESQFLSNSKTYQHLIGLQQKII